MSSTIYGNTTLNGVNIDDIVDDNRDIVWSIYGKFFARLVFARDNVRDVPSPAIAIFTYDDAFYALFAKVLPGSYDMYWDGWGTTELFKKELDKFIEEFQAKNECKVFQFLYSSSEEKDGVGNITCNVKGSSEALTIAEWLWKITLTLSYAEFRDGETEYLLKEEGYDEEEIERILKIYPEGLSEDPIVAYGQCIEKFKNIGLVVEYMDDCDNPDVWTSHGVY